MFVDGGNVSIEDSVIEGNHASGSGGVYAGGNLLLNNVRIASGSALDNGGGWVDSIRVPAGERVRKPEDPVLEGSIFTGWYTSQNTTEIRRYDFDRTVENSFTLYAGWQDITTETERLFHPAYISGYPGNQFYPDCRVTRGEAVCAAAVPHDHER